MNATDFTANARDVRFVLFEQLKVQELCKAAKYKDFDQETFDAMITEAVKLSEKVLDPLNRPGDLEGCHYDKETKAVTTPKGFKEAFYKFRDGGWSGMAGSPEYGGMGLPPVVSIALGEFFTGANVSFCLYGLLVVGGAHVIEKYGNQEMKDTYLPRLYDGTYGATMVLTEPGAGSDVGNSRAKAVKDPEGFYRITGDKIFITGGEHDLTNNIIHLVLARVEGAPRGTKGLSLFLVPKYRLNPDGSDGPRNDMYCAGIEHKLGIRGSATCQLTFGDNGDCRGWLIGNEGDGMRIMFNMMNEARIDCGVQGMAAVSASYFNALAYAKERLQGSTIENMKDPDAPRAPIVVHPDIRRMLMSMKAYAEGLRVLLLKTIHYETLSEVAEDPEEKTRFHDFLELLTPICKAYSSDRGFDMCSYGVQILGGYGYLQDYPLEQRLRDVRIASIYEGANGIQAMDLLGRKLGMKGGMVLMTYIAELMKDVEAWKGVASLKDLAEDYEAAVNEFTNVGTGMVGMAMAGKLDVALANALPFLYVMGDVVVAGGLLEQAAIAQAWLDKRFAAEGLADEAARKALVADNAEAQFYAGKVAQARFFVKSVLPHVFARTKAILAEDDSIFQPVL
jgi:alkylation response protein AidB-like acyl-CoA dehydrogenase